MHYTETTCRLVWDDLPPDVRAQAKRCLKDIMATAAGSLLLPANEQMARLVRAQYAPGPAPLWFKGVGLNTVGAAYFNAQAVDSLDCHDGFRPNKGHCGATVVPVVVGACAACERPLSGAELLTAIVIGYEMASRAGMALHALYAPDYHASGSWAALGAAAGAAKLIGFPAAEMDAVLGMAEYYAPMAPMIRCTEHPSIVKDAAGPGAWAAAMALAIHAVGGAGLPSIFTSGALGRQQAATLGGDWMILRQYFKPYPTCRWTQPVVEGLRALQRVHGFTATHVAAIEIESFDCAATIMSFPPTHSDAAQYSLPWAVAAFLADGELGVAQVHPDRLRDPQLLDLGRRVSIRVAADIQERFPAEALARTTVVLKEGQRLTSPTLSARGDWTDPLSTEELDAKAAHLFGLALGDGQADRVVSVLDSLDRRPASDLLRVLAEPPRGGRP